MKPIFEELFEAPPERLLPVLERIAKACESIAEHDQLRKLCKEQGDKLDKLRMLSCRKEPVSAANVERILAGEWPE